MGPILALLLFVVLAFVAYWPARSGEFIWDDEQYIPDNPHLREAAGLWRIWFEPSATPQYYPLTFTSFWVEYHLWGTSTAGYHAVNVTLHALNTWLLWIVLRRLRAPGSFLAALVFLLHPANVASVAWIAERKNVLSALFALLAVLLWVRFLRNGARSAVVGALLLFALGLLSKTVICGLPAVMATIAWWRGGERWRRQVWWTIPFFALAVALAVVTAWREHAHRLDETGFSPDRDALAVFLLACRACVFYASKLIWPVELMPIYPRLSAQPAVGWHWLFPAGILAALAAAWFARRRIGRGPLVGVLAFGLLLAPSLGFVDFGFRAFSDVADHFLYHAALVGVPLAVAMLIGAARRIHRVVDRALIVVLLAVAGAFGALTWREAGAFATREAFWSHALDQYPNATAYSALGDVFIRRAASPDGTLDRRLLDRGIDLQNHAIALHDSAKAHLRLGTAYMLYRDEPHLHLARQEIEHALVLLGRGGVRELRANAYFNLGAIHWNLGNRAAAVNCWRRSLALNPYDRVAQQWLRRAERDSGTQPPR